MILRILRVLGLSSTANAPANYTAVNEGRLEFTAEGVAVQAPLVHLIDEGGNSVAPLTDDQLRAEPVPVDGTFWQDTQPISAEALPLPEGAATKAQQITANAALDSIFLSIGTKADDEATGDAVETSLISLVKRLLGKLNKNANGNLSTAIAESLPAGTNAIGEVKTVRKTSEAVAYSAVMSLLPTTLTQNTTYGCIRNPSSNKTIKIKRINLSLVFGGTATAGRNFFWIRRVTASAMSGATAVDVAKFSSAAAAPVAQVGSSNAGITFTSGVLDAGGLGIFSVATQLSGATLYSEDFSDAPIVLAQSEGLVLQGLSGTLVAGTSAFLTFEWTEE